MGNLHAHADTFPRACAPCRPLVIPLYRADLSRKCPVQTLTWFPNLCSPNLCGDWRSPTAPPSVPVSSLLPLRQQVSCVLTSTPPPTSVPVSSAAPLNIPLLASQTCADSPSSPAAVSHGVCLFDPNTGKLIAHCQEQCGGTLCPVTSTTCLSKHSCSWVATVMKTPVRHESCPAPSLCCRLECSWEEYRNLRRW